MPHAIQIRQTGGPEVLKWTPVEVGEPGASQVRLRQAAAGLNYIDVYHRTGSYSQPLPFIPGVEGAGVVEAIGQAVRGLKVGDRVAYAGPAGGYSEVRLINADRWVRLPDAISFEQAAAMMLQGMTAQALIRRVYPVKTGDLTGAPSPTDLAAILSVEPAEVSQVFFAGVGVQFCFAQLSSSEAVDRAAINRAAWAATLSRTWSPHIFFFAGDLRHGGKLYARMCAPALGVEEDPATGSACAALVGVMASKPEFGGTTYRLSIEQGVAMGRRSEIEAEALRSGADVTSVSVSGATTYVASGEIEVPPFALAPPAERK